VRRDIGAESAKKDPVGYVGYSLRQHQAIKEEGKIRELYLRVSEKRGHNRAVVAAAREVATAIFWMLKRMEPYRASGKRYETIVASEAG